MISNITKFLFILLFIFSVNTAFAQQSSKRPKIGVTLSGGGAKGLAHIGILQAMDSAGLKVDFITGTSMGSVVGGLYAAGYSADTIEKIARTLDWSLLFSTAPQIASIGIEEKDEFNKYALEIPFQHGKFKLGKGIIEGQELWLKFAELFQPVYNINDFNKLSIPFACIGTDLSTGNPVVMNKGNIIDCIRASMAIPSVFTPVQYEGKTLVDGGIVNNFPVLDIKSMGADYVIGVNLNKGLDKAEDLNNIVDILMQLAFFKDASTFEVHKAACDLYIMPDLQGNGAGSFANSDSIIDIGKQCGLLFYPYFKHLADSLNAIYPNSTPPIKYRLPKTKSMSISKYSVTGLNKTTEKFFFGLYGLGTDQTYSNEKHAESIRKVYGSRYYKKIQYDCITTDSISTEMKFKVEENPLTAIKFAFNYNTYTNLNLIGNITVRDFIFKESRAMATASLSENPRMYFEYYKYLGRKRRTGVSGSLYKENVDFPIYENFNLFTTLRSSYDIYELKVQNNLSRIMYVGLKQQYTKSTIKTPEDPKIDYNGKNKFWYSGVTYRLNNLDKKYFATSGWKVKADAGYIYNQIGSASITQDSMSLNADSMGFTFNDCVKIHINAEHYVPLNPKFALIENASIAYMITKNPYLPNTFQVGGVLNNVVNQVQFAGLNESEIKTGSIISAQAGLQWKINNSVYLIGRANIALYNFHEVPAKNLTANKNLLSGYSLTLGMMTPIGPILISGVYCDQDGKIRTNLNLGYAF